MSRAFTPAAILVSLFTVIACGRTDASNSQPLSERNFAAASGDSVVIRTTDGSMKLGLAHDTVYMGLTDSVLTAARQDMARDTEETKSAIAGTIERLVKKSVSSALQTQLKYPLTDLDSVTYQGGTIKFAYRNKRRVGFEDVSQNDHKALRSFAPEDAQQFVNTVNSAISATRGTFQRQQ